LHMLGKAAPDLVATEPAKLLAWLFTFADSDAHRDSIYNEHLSLLLSSRTLLCLCSLLYITMSIVLVYTARVCTNLAAWHVHEAPENFFAGGRTRHLACPPCRSIWGGYPFAHVQPIGLVSLLR